MYGFQVEGSRDKIKKADIKLDGITVICGDNNTGKSTIGKSLFSFYNALYDYKTKISMQKDSRFKNFYLVEYKLHGCAG